MRLETSTCHTIDNIQGKEISELEKQNYLRLERKFPQIRPRTDFSPFYNCHGLTFASRRTCITKSTMVKIILEHDKYEEIDDIKKVIAGDIIVYYSDLNDYNHSGVVVENIAPLYVPIICSKWGKASEYLHTIGDIPEDLYGPNKKFFRCRL
jgi:hypothetical protein